jgi:hypothetical protein
MLKGFRQKIRQTTSEAVDLAIKAIETSNEAMIVRVSIPRDLQKATVVVQGQKRPFPLTKLATIIRAVRGKWTRKRTLCKFTKVESIRHSSAIPLIMRVYSGACLNPESDMEVKVGSRGEVLNPEQCNGAEFSIMRGLGINVNPKQHT